MHLAFIKAILPIWFLAIAYGKPDKGLTHEALASTTLLTLGEIDIETENNLSIVTIRLDQSPEWKTLGPIQNHGAFFQLTLPGTIVPEPGKFYDLGKPYLAKVGVFQISPSDAAIRLFTASEYNSTEIFKGLKTEILGSRILITFDHQAIGPANAKGQNQHEIGPPYITNKPSADEVIAKTKVREDLPAPADMVKLTYVSSAPSTRSYLSKLAIVGAFLTSLILISIGIRTTLRRKTSALKNMDTGVTLKTLASMALAPRQKVSVIQVGNEKILLGLTPDSITFLTSLSQDQSRPVPARSTHHSAPQLPSDPVVFKTEGEKFPNQKPTGLSRTGGFSALVRDDKETLKQIESPRLKKIPGNDEATLRTRKVQSDVSKIDLTAPKPFGQKMAPRGNQINISIGEDGVKDVSRRNGLTTQSNQGSPPQETIDDVTRLIREKLKNFKTI